MPGAARVTMSLNSPKREWVYDSWCLSVILALLLVKLACEIQGNFAATKTTGNPSNLLSRKVADPAPLPPDVRSKLISEKCYRPPSSSAVAS